MTNYMRGFLGEKTNITACLPVGGSIKRARTRGKKTSTVLKTTRLERTKIHTNITHKLAPQSKLLKKKGSMNEGNLKRKTAR